MPSRAALPLTRTRQEWEADIVLAEPGPELLTLVHGPGKTSGATGSEQGMTLHQTRPAAACQSPGPPVDVVTWRACRLREAGFPTHLAEALAVGHVDLHALLQLVDAGCPPELAARILSPDDDRLAPW
jgi:hypothetical protein